MVVTDTFLIGYSYVKARCIDNSKSMLNVVLISDSNTKNLIKHSKKKCRIHKKIKKQISKYNDKKLITTPICMKSKSNIKR